MTYMTSPSTAPPSYIAAPDRPDAAFKRSLHFRRPLRRQSTVIAQDPNDDVASMISS